MADKDIPLDNLSLFKGKLDETHQQVGQYLTISNVLTYIGETITVITDDSSNPNITINGNTVVATNRNAVSYGHKGFIWTGTKWGELGDESGASTIGNGVCYTEIV